MKRILFFSAAILFGLISLSCNKEQDQTEQIPLYRKISTFNGGYELDNQAAFGEGFSMSVVSSVGQRSTGKLVVTCSVTPNVTGNLELPSTIYVEENNDIIGVPNVRSLFVTEGVPVQFTITFDSMPASFVGRIISLHIDSLKLVRSRHILIIQLNSTWN